MHLLTRDNLSPDQAKDRSFDEIVAMLDANGGRTNSGIVVTSQVAMQQSTVWACVRVVAEVISQLPIYMQAKRGGKWVDIDDHQALRVLAFPNEWQTPHEFISHLIVWAELQGNGFYYKQLDGTGRARQLLPLRGDAVAVEQKRDWSLTYKVAEANGFQGTFSAKEIFHLRNFGSNGYTGLSTITNMRNAIGLALQTEEHGATLFKNGAQLGKVFMLPNANAQQTKEFKEQIERKYQGAHNAHLPFVAGGGVDVKELGMSNEDAQFLETRAFQKQEIAGIFGVPLFILNDTQKSTTWGTGLEQQLRAFLTLSLAPRLQRMKQTLARELLLPKERGRLRFQVDTDELTLGDFKERMEGYAKGIESGVLNPNEAREIEGRNPRDGGDDYVIKPTGAGDDDEQSETDDPSADDQGDLGNGDV